MDTALDTSPHGLRGMIARLFETPFDRRAQSLSDRVAQLRSLSDAELAEQGITRDGIIDHVFRSGQAN